MAPGRTRLPPGPSVSAWAPFRTRLGWVLSCLCPCPCCSSCGLVRDRDYVHVHVRVRSPSPCRSPVSPVSPRRAAHPSRNRNLKSRTTTMMTRRSIRPRPWVGGRCSRLQTILVSTWVEAVRTNVTHLWNSSAPVPHCPPRPPPTAPTSPSPGARRADGAPGALACWIRLAVGSVSPAAFASVRARGRFAAVGMP